MIKINRFLLIGLVVAISGILIAGFASPIFAHGPGDGGVTSSNGEAWEEMHQACENDDYEAMVEWHAEYDSAEDPMNEGMAGSGMMGMMGGMH